MFKKFISKAISVLEHTTNELKRAYSETYDEADCKALTQDFMEEVNRRKDFNRKKLLQIMTNFVIDTTLKEHNYLMPFEQAVKIAKAMYNEAKLYGKIDELNCYVIE